MAASGSNTAACKGKKNVTCRRSWTRTEEDVLVNALKEIVSTGWKSDNGFRVGYLNVLQDKLQKVFPTTDLRANPHISSKMHAWKRQYNSLFLVFGHTGVGWNHTTKMIETDSDEHWEAACKTEPNARCLRNKSWPYYDSWCEIFGKDRANGYGAEDFQDALNGVLNMQNEADDNQEINLEDKLVATNLIVKNPQVLAMFLSLPPLQKLGKFV